MKNQRKYHIGDIVKHKNFPMERRVLDIYETEHGQMLRLWGFYDFVSTDMLE